MAPSQMWKCQICLIQNEDEYNVCEACATPRQVSPSSIGKSIHDSESLLVDSVKRADADVVMKIQSHDVQENAEMVKIAQIQKHALASPKGVGMPTGILYMFGSGEMDQFPFAVNGEQAKPKEVRRLNKKKIHGVVCGGFHTTLLVENGHTIAFGCNDEGTLGRDKPNENSVSESIPAPMNLPTLIVKVTCGDSHTACLSKEGSVYLCGTYRDKMMKLGFPDYNSPAHEQNKANSFVCEKVCFPSNVCITQMESGEDHTIVLDSNNTVWGWGSNEFGQLAKPVLEGEDSLDEVKKKSLLLPQKLTSKILGFADSTTIEKIHCGRATTFFTTSNPTSVYGVGRNSNGEVGVDLLDITISQPTQLSISDEVEFITIKGGQHFSAALTNLGNVYSWGLSPFCGHGEIETRAIKTPQCVKYLSNIPVVVSFLECGSDHTLAVTNSGHLFTWGAGQNFQLGNEKDVDFQYIPYLVDPKCFGNKYVLQASGGSQHSAVLLWDKHYIDEESKAVPKRKLESPSGSEKVKIGRYGDAAKNMSTDSNVLTQLQKNHDRMSENQPGKKLLSPPYSSTSDIRKSLRMTPARRASYAAQRDAALLREMRNLSAKKS